jgi:hypothetical protein
MNRNRAWTGPEFFFVVMSPYVWLAAAGALSNFMHDTLAGVLSAIIFLSLYYFMRYCND